MFKYELFSVYGSYEIPCGSYDNLDNLLFMIYYLGEDRPDSLYRISPFDVYVRPYGVLVRDMYKIVYNKIF